MKQQKIRLTAGVAALCAAVLVGCGAASSASRPSASATPGTSSSMSQSGAGEWGESNHDSSESNAMSGGSSAAANEIDIPSSLTILQEGTQDEVPALTHHSPLGLVLTYANEAYTLEETEDGLILVGNTQASQSVPESYLTITRLEDTRENALESIRSEHSIEEEVTGTFGRQDYPADSLYGSEGTAGTADARSVEYYVTEQNGAVFVVAMYYSPDRAESDGAWLRAMLSTIQFDAES